ncbi:cadherin-related family member 4-like [Pelobates fuscus]|uniref:cadherin-related family member 4-like n=1 Tax=Pelobates fuscus TaxID=191477 RepID=UPI002FE4D3A6
MTSFQLIFETTTLLFEISILSPDTIAYFKLDEDTGIISTTGTPLDYEKNPKKFAIPIKVSNTKHNASSCTGLITISLHNENDEAPIFKSFTDKLNVLENLTPGMVIYTLQADDRDVDDSVHYEFANFYNGFFIDEDSGEIKVSFPLDYENPSTLHEQRLVVHAVDNDRVHSTEAVIMIKLIDVNDNYPQCDGFPNVIEVAETIPVGTLLMSLLCRDNDVNAPNNVLKYNMGTLDVFSNNKFTLTGNKLTVGPNSFDYDNETFAGMQFIHSLLIEVSDSGAPSLTSTVAVIVRVTRVNEASPTSSTNEFFVQENSPMETMVGKVNFADTDWPFNNMKFTFDSGDYGNPPRFYIEPETGVIKVLNQLDFEKKNQYSITVQAIDLNNDIQPDPLKQLKKLAVATIHITNVNDEAPVCVPAYYENIIYSTTKLPVIQLQCFDKDSSADQLSYSIISGNTPERFALQRNGLDYPFLVTNQNFQYNVFEGIKDPTVFQLLFEVTDEFGGNKALQLSTTATVIIHVIPWVTTLPTTPSEPTTTTVTTSVLVRTSYFWHPDNWFPAVITITAALFLLCLYALAWGFLKDVPKYAIFFPLCRSIHKPLKSPKPSVPEKSAKGQSKKQDSLSNNQQPAENPNILPGNPVDAALYYDGRAIDPASGSHYLFNSQTGGVKWLN